MNRYIKYIFALIIILILAYIFCVVKHQFTMIDYMLINNLQCGKPMCDIDVNTNLPVLMPPSDLKLSSDTISFHKSLINFMASIIYYSLNDQNYISLMGMTSLKQIDTSTDKLIAVVSKIEGIDNVLLIGIRGTQNLSDLLEDTHIAQVPFTTTFTTKGNTGHPMCHQGFLNVHNQIKNQVINQIHDETQIILTGHSLGAAVACLLGMTIKMIFPSIQVGVVAYACPRLGNKDLCDTLNNNIQIIRIRNDSDAVPNFPSAVSPNEDDPTQPWLYFHAENQQVLFNDNWKSVMNNHLIPVYLNFMNNL